MTPPRSADSEPRRHRPQGRWRGRIDWVLGALVVAAWSVVAIDADRSLRSAQAAVEAKAAEAQCAPSGPVMRSGRTQASNSAAVTWPEATAASRSDEPSRCARLAISAALS
jgi:hypothetical protein